ncbi:MAG TPA: copper resistance protein CopC [Candidatus Dormibacteraeota bacterium]
MAASAHALLISSNPSPGQSLGTGPGVVVLEFSEPLNPRLSSVSVTDPTGRKWSGQVSGAQEMRVPVQTNAQGTYTVDWTSVSITDGHHIADSFTFAVGVRAGVAPGSTGSLGDPQAADVLIGVAKWAEALALLALLGQLLIAQLARRPPSLDWVQPRLALAPIALTFGLIVVWAEAFTASGGHSAASFTAFFTTSLSGVARLMRLGFEILAVVAFVRRGRTIWLWTVGALVALSASGHAAGVEPAWWGIGIDSVHLVAAGLWAGGIIALATQRPAGGWRSAAMLQLLIRFSPVALAAFVITVAGGGLEAVFQLGAVSALISTDYGRVLLAKIVLVAFMLPLSLVAWRLRRPRPRIEAAIAACVIAAAALLASFPLPPTEAASRLAQQAAVPAAQGLPRPGDVTLATNAGSVLVGLSLHPGLPGRNRVTAYLVPIEGNSAAAVLVANATVGTTSLPLRSCGEACRQATFTLHGGETLDVDVLNPAGGRASFTIPALPAPDGSSEAALMQRVMHSLKAYHAAETLTSGGAVVASEFSSVAPDRSVWAVNGLTNNIWIGTTQYTRAGADQPWQVSSGLPDNAVPSFVWDYFAPLSDAHVVGSDTIDGVPTTVVAGFGNRSGTPIWFRFWLDATGRVRQVDMDAPGHFMVDHYLSFNAPVQIAPPVASSG